MAPTRNSTLIHSDDSNEQESSMGATEKELSQYSPILARPPRNAIKSTFTSSSLDYVTPAEGSNSSQNTNGAAATAQEEINEIPIWICGEPRFVSGITNQTTCSNIIEALIEDELHALDSNGRDPALSHDLCDYVITERWRDVEQPLPGNTFIWSLWKAWGTKSATNEVKFKLRVNKWGASKGSQLEVASNRQSQRKQAIVQSEKEQVTENEQELPQKVKKHERKSSERMTAINKMMRKILKQGETIKQHLSQLSDSQAEVQRIEKLCKKIRQSKQGKTMLMEHFINSTNLMAKGDLEMDPLLLPGTLSSALTSEDELFYMDHPILTDTETAAAVEMKAKVGQMKRAAKAAVENDEEEDDELFLVIENNDDLDSGVHFDLNKRSKSQLTEMQPICSSIEMTEVLLETPKRKKRIQRNFEDLKRHSLNRKFCEEIQQRQSNAADETPMIENPDFKRTSLQFDTIRREIIVKMNDLKDLLQKEEDLIANLESKCQKYKRENEVYGKRQGVQRVEVDEIQDNLNRYAKEIVKHEFDLYKTKLEIRENYLILDDLKEMLAEKDPISNFGRSEFNRLVEKKFGLEANPSSSSSLIKSPFVDNVHEFCDNNNDSIIV